MNNGKENPEKESEDKSQAFRKALRRMFERKNAEQQIEEIEKIAAIGGLPKDKPSDTADD